MTNLFALLSRDRVDTAALDEIFNRNCNREEFPRELVATLGLLDPGICWRTTWLILRLARDRRPMDENVLAEIATSADAATHWVARLNLCQVFGHVPCPEPALDLLFPFLAKCFADRRVIIRAWAITALLPFRSNPRYQPEVERMLAEALKEKSKSMQARLRRAAADNPIAEKSGRGLPQSKTLSRLPVRL